MSIGLFAPLATLVYLLEVVEELGHDLWGGQGEEVRSVDARVCECVTALPVWVCVREREELSE